MPGIVHLAGEFVLLARAHARPGKRVRSHSTATEPPCSLCLSEERSQSRVKCTLSGVRVYFLFCFVLTFQPTFFFLIVFPIQCRVFSSRRSLRFVNVWLLRFLLSVSDVQPDVLSASSSFCSIHTAPPPPRSVLSINAPPQPPPSHAPGKRITVCVCVCVCVCARVCVCVCESPFVCV